MTRDLKKRVLTARDGMSTRKYRYIYGYAPHIGMCIRRCTIAKYNWVNQFNAEMTRRLPAKEYTGKYYPVPIYRGTVKIYCDPAENRVYRTLKARYKIILWILGIILFPIFLLADLVRRTK